MNPSAALQYLFSALAHARHACQRTRDMVARAIARYITLVAAQ
jgi:hypothetical protein